MPALIGFDMCHYAILSTDSAGGATYETPVRIVGAISANINPNSSEETLFADNGPMESSTALGAVDLELSCADFPLDVQAVLLGHKYNKGFIERSSTDTPPFIAIGGRALKSNGKYRYFWLLKGKMSQPEQERKTKGDSVEYQTPTIKGSFVKRDFDNLWITEFDEDGTGAPENMATRWFSKVIGPTEFAEFLE